MFQDWSAPVVAALAAGFRFQLNAANDDRFVQRLGHVVNRERGDGDCGQRFHFYTGRASGGYLGVNLYPGCCDFSTYINKAERERMAHWDECRGLLGCLNTGKASDFERIALGILRQCCKNSSGEFNEGGGFGFAAGLNLVTDIDHAGVSRRVKVAELRLAWFGHGKSPDEQLPAYRTLSDPGDADVGMSA